MNDEGKRRKNGRKRTYKNTIKEIKKCLSDKSWLKNNLSLSNYLSDKKAVNDEEYKFDVLTAKSENPVVIVRVESPNNLCLMAIAVKYKNNKVIVANFSNQPAHNSHSNYEVNDEYVAEVYGHMGYWMYTIYEVKDTGIKK